MELEQQCLPTQVAVFANGLEGEFGAKSAAVSLAESLSECAHEDSYFFRFGAKKMALLLIKDAAMQLANDPNEESEETRTTVAWVSGQVAPVMFEHCAQTAELDTIDGDNVVDDLRKMILEHPRVVLKAIDSFLKSDTSSHGEFSSLGGFESSGVAEYHYRNPRDNYRARMGAQS